MSQMSNYLENALINGTLRGVQYTVPATVYVGLHTASPGEIGDGAEVSGGDYARQAVTFGAPANGVSTNSADVTFPTATGAWGTITSFGIWDASSAGNLLYYGNLGTNKTVASTDVVKILTSALSVTLS